MGMVIRVLTTQSGHGDGDPMHNFLLSLVFRDWTIYTEMTSGGLVFGVRALIVVEQGFQLDFICIHH